MRNEMIECVNVEASDGKLSGQQIEQLGTMLSACVDMGSGYLSPLPPSPEVMEAASRHYGEKAPPDINTQRDRIFNVESMVIIASLRHDEGEIPSLILGPAVLHLGGVECVQVAESQQWIRLLRRMLEARDLHQTCRIPVAVSEPGCHARDGRKPSILIGWP